ncbi:MAG TPA: hypothetical protein EYQ11_00825 [Candidatus Poseidoniales archaeon]|jgi:hypothetical protein|nr:MAG: hypothetical protein CXT66_02515 [Euryarchaeota archaeon]HIG33412.1 hypothetical protein [Candidatus Poseidoniales archaeon]
MLIPVGFDLEASELPDSTILNASESAPDANLYKLYFVWPGQNQTSGMDGLISTEPPEADQDQEVASALDDDVQFMSISLMSSMEFFGRKFHADNSYYIPVELFLKSEGSQNSNVDWTVSVMTSERTVGSTIYSGSVCSSSFGSSCDFDHEIIDVGIGNSESFQVGKNERLIIKVRASMSGCDDSDNPFGGSCTAEVAFNNIDNEPNKFSKMEANGNALMNSIIVVQREGANIAEGSVVDWYPNDIVEDREMQFSIDAISAFGRADVARVDILMRGPDGNYEVDERITGDLEEIEDSSTGIFGKFLYTYNSGLSPGEYTVVLKVQDIGGNEIEIEHEPIEMHQFGVSLKHRFDRSVEYFAPGKVTPIPMVLVHRGDSTKSMNVELEVLTNLGNSWLVEFDSPAGYEMSSGGSVMNPTVTLTAPDDLTGMPKKIEIRAVAEADVDGVISVVHQDTLVLIVEKIDVYQPPVVSIWSEDHKMPIANSSRGDALDSTIPRFAEYGEFNPFILEIFNTGFDADTFRIDILKRSKSIFQLHDNLTGQRILQDEGDGTFHTPLLERHSTKILILGVKPSLDREDEDIGEIEIEVISGGNASSTTTVSFTIQRTYGIRGEVSQDCDGTPLGHMKVALCAPGQDRPVLDFRARLTNSKTDLEAASWWLLQNPASLIENTVRNSAYGQWEFKITNSDGEAVPRVSLGPGDFTEVYISVTLTNQVEVGNHTVFLRIVEDIEDDDPRYFDLPMTFEIEADQPMLEIVQVSQNTKLAPGNDYSIQMKVKNEGNSPITVLLEADVDESGWDVSIGGLSGSPLIEIDAFDEATFTVEISVSSSANNGVSIPISVIATPLDTDQSFSESLTAKFTLTAIVEIGSFVDIIVNEMSHPRPITLVLVLVSVLLLFAGVQSRLNRRRWAGQMRMIESISDDETESQETTLEIPTPVTVVDEPKGVERYDDDDVELV